MTTKNKLITTTLLSASAIASIALINQCLKLSATARHVLDEPESLCYHWRLGDIHYTKCGSGHPLLLIHDISPASSGYQWSHIRSTLSAHFTVYTIDLLGCGRSEKPDLTYTNYLFVQLISDFIKSEIGHRTDVITTGNCWTLVIMACDHNPELFNRLLLINPQSISACSHLPGKYAKIYKSFLDFPVIGTLIHNIAFSRHFLLERFRRRYFSNPFAVKDTDLTAYHEAAHLGASAKSIYASVHCGYTNCNITNALKRIDNSIYLVGGEDFDQESDILKEYTLHNPAIEYTLIPKTKFLPQLEKPAQLLHTIQMYFGF